MVALSKLQKRVLITEHLLPAWRVQGEKFRARGREWDENGFDDWRHGVVAAACGKDGLTCCGQEDFAEIIAKCWELRGESGIALKVLMNHEEGNDRRQVEWKLARELERGGMTRGYAERICMAAHRVSLGEASVRQLWMVFYTVRNRVNGRSPQNTQRTQKGSDGSDGSDGSEKLTTIEKGT